MIGQECASRAEQPTHHPWPTASAACEASRRTRARRCGDNVLTTESQRSCKPGENPRTDCKVWRTPMRNCDVGMRTTAAASPRHVYEAAGGGVGGRQ